MSGSQPAADDGAGTEHRLAQPGLVGKLIAAIRPEFRGDVLEFDASDPVFGGGLCRVPGCGRTAQAAGMCGGHRQRWVRAGRPDEEKFAALAGPGWLGHAELAACLVPGCEYGIGGRQLCIRHRKRWQQAGEPDPAAWAQAVPVTAIPGQEPRACQVSYCRLWAHTGTALCYSHFRGWKRSGRDLGEYIRSYDEPAAGEQQKADMTVLGRQLRLELQYALQCRRDDTTAKTRPTTIRSVTAWLAGSGVTSILDRGEQAWRGSRPPAIAAKSAAAALLIYTHRKVALLAEGTGWDTEYPRDTWRLSRLGMDAVTAGLRFGGIPQPWLKDLAKRWIRWRLSAALSGAVCWNGLGAITHLAQFLEAAGVTSLAEVTRDVLERYLAELRRAHGGKRAHGSYIGQISTFFLDIRRHQWDTTLPSTALFFPEDFPRRDRSRLPRALAEHIMTQVEAPASLSRWDNAAYHLITIILIRCGLRVSDAAEIPYECLAHDGDRAPYLRYYNQKMKREALVPVDEQTEALIKDQQLRARQFRPGTPVLFPSATANVHGRRPVSSCAYRQSLYRWLELCDVRDEHGKPVRLTPHQWRHTLGTRLINRDVPQHIVQKILDHDSAEMTAHYARLSDTTVREHWDKARKINASGQPVTITPDGPLSDAAWAKQRISRATQALPNGYCQLPMVKTCPHANACLTCPMFVTTAEFLPQHHAQHRAALQLITAAEAAGHARVAEMNKQVAANLDKIITALQSGDGEQDTAHAS